MGKNAASGSVALSTHIRGRPRKVPVWELRYRLPNGKQSDKVLGKAWTRRSRAPLGFLSRLEADAAAERFLSAHAREVPASRKTFGLACRDFLDHCEQERRLRGSTLYGYARVGSQLCRTPWTWGRTWNERPLGTFVADDVQVVRSDLIARGLSPQSVNHRRIIIAGVFGNGPITEAWPRLPIREKASERLRFYSIEEVQALKACALTPTDAAIFTIATEAGPRMSEILALRVRHVDFGGGLLRFEDGYTRTGGFAGTKGHRVRSVPMTPNIRAALLPRCAEAAAADLVFGREDRPGEPLSGNALFRRFQTAAANAGLPRLRFHDLRHTFATQAVSTGRVDLVALQRLMGHRSITTTEIYLHYKPDPELAARLSAPWLTE